MTLFNEGKSRKIEKTKCANCGYEYPVISLYCHLCGWQRRLTEEEKKLFSSPSPKIEK